MTDFSINKFDIFYRRFYHITAFASILDNVLTGYQRDKRRMMTHRIFLPIVIVLLFLSFNLWAQSQYLGNLSVNPYSPNSTSNSYGQYGNKYGANSIKNPYGPYGSPYSSKSISNPYATQSPKLYDSKGNYRGKLSSNPYDPDSISNPYGRYGNRYSPDSINNPYGAGSKYRSDSPFNPYGTGWKIVGE